MERPKTVSEIEEQSRKTEQSPRYETLEDSLLEEDQKNAIRRVMDWHNNPKKQVLTLGGRAGSGKTTILKKILSQIPDSAVAVASFTGKAVSQLRRKGIEFAQTLHSLMYVPDGKDAQGRLLFKKVTSLPFDTVYVDEGSMVSDEIHKDLLSFGVNILYCGDHWQLEPIGKNPNLMAKPDIILEKIHRQARNSPIIQFSDAVYKGLMHFPHRKTSELEIAPAPRFWSALKETDIALVGRNKTRHQANDYIRRQKGFSGKYPQVGEKVICLRNNREFGVYNGLIATVTKAKLEKKVYVLDIEDDLGNQFTGLPTLPEQYGENSMADVIGPDYLLFDFGYVLTVHKSQGSEWDNVVILEEIMGDWNPNRWRYTAVTRAAKKLIYCR